MRENSNEFKVLIVDDHKENLVALEAILDILNITILKATSGNEALGLMLEHEISILLLDIQMPDMDGFEVAELMRKNSRTKYIPIIFITAISREERYKFKAYDVGAVDFILKPIIPEILVSKIKVFIQLYEQKLKIIEQTKLLKGANQILKDLSYLDGLTHIPNRRRLDMYLEEQWKIAKRNQYTLALIMIDIDLFKDYNDYYGHLKGDDCLIKVAKFLDYSTNGTNYFISRYGGEEFIVVLPKTNKNTAKDFASQLCKNIHKLSIKHEKSEISKCVTISCGVTSIIPNEDSSPDILINQADKALYIAKDKGRNNVVYYNE